MDGGGARRNAGETGRANRIRSRGDSPPGPRVVPDAPVHLRLEEVPIAFGSALQTPPGGGAQEADELLDSAIKKFRSDGSSQGCPRAGGRSRPDRGGPGLGQAGSFPRGRGTREARAHAGAAVEPLAQAPGDADLPFPELAKNALLV